MLYTAQPRPARWRVSRSLSVHIHASRGRARDAGSRQDAPRSNLARTPTAFPTLFLFFPRFPCPSWYRDRGRRREGKRRGDRSPASDPSLQSRSLARPWSRGGGGRCSRSSSSATAGQCIHGLGSPFHPRFSPFHFLFCVLVLCWGRACFFLPCVFGLTRIGLASVGSARRRWWTSILGHGNVDEISS
jgi:hypothetical protein